MKFEISLIEKEYDILMRNFGKYGKNCDGATGAIKRLIKCIPEFEHLARSPVSFLHTRELYRDEDLVITINRKGIKNHLLQYREFFG